MYYVAVLDWYHRFEHLIESNRDHLPSVPVDEIKLDMADVEVYIYTTVGINIFGVLHVDGSPGQSKLGPLLFLKDVLKGCRGLPVILADRDPWNDWPLDLLECEPKRDAW